MLVTAEIVVAAAVESRHKVINDHK